MRDQWQRLSTQLRTGAIGRREFLAGAAALGISTTSIGEALAQTPKRGGHLVMGVSQASTTDTLDGATWNSIYPPIVGVQVYDMLTVVSEKMEAKPALAESWTFKPGATVWVFKLRKGVTFHNGKSLTAADVVYSLNHHRGPDAKSTAKSLVSSFQDVTASGPDEVTITLSGGNVDLPYLLADWHLPIVPEGSKFDGVGTGAYVLEKFEPGVRAMVKRNPNDYRQDRGYIETVETLAINDSTARVSALLSGSAQIIDTIPGASVSLLEGNAKVSIVTAVGGQHGTMPTLTDREPYNNLDLRLALKYAMDREAVLKTVLRGYGKVANDQPVPSYDPMFAADIPQRKYDPDKAKFHYKKSGYTGPITFTTADSTFNGAVATAQIFQASAKKAGINVEINRVPDDAYFSKYFATGAANFYASVWGGRPTADLVLTACYSSTSNLNESKWKNEKFDQLLTAARAEADTAKRKQMYHDLQLMVTNDAGTVIPTFQNFVDGAAKNVRGFAGSPMQRMSGYRVAEKVWLA